MLGKILQVGCLWLLLGAVVFGADPVRAVGDKVEFELSRRKYEGVISEVHPGGYYTVKYKVYGKELTQRIPERWILEKGKAKKEKPAASEKSKESEKPAPKKEEMKEKGDAGAADSKEEKSKLEMRPEKPKGGADKEESSDETTKTSPLLEEYHEWKDSTGKRGLTAKFLGLDEKTKVVRLVQKDQKSIPLPLSHLSEESLELARHLATLKRGGGGDAVESKSVLENRAKRQMNAEPSPDSYTKLDWSRVWEITTFETPVIRYKAPQSDSVEPIAKPGAYLLESSLRGGNGRWLEQREIDRLLFSNAEEGSQNLHLISHHFSDITLQTIDLKSGEVSPPIACPEKFTVLAVHPDGERLMATGTDGESTDQIVLLNTVGDRASIEQGWFLNRPEEDGNRKAISERPSLFKDSEAFTSNPNIPKGFGRSGVDFEKAQFIDKDHVQIDFSISYKNYTILVQMSTGRVMYRLKYDGWQKSGTVHSPDLKTFCVYIEGEVFLFDSLSGNQVGWIPHHAGREEEGTDTFGRLAFSPDGKALAIWRWGGLQIWDLVGNRELQFVEIGTGIESHDSLFWVAEDYLLVDGAMLYHKGLGTPIWGYVSGDRNYTPHGEAGIFFGGLLWYELYSKDGKERGLFAVKIPEAVVIERTPAPKPPEYVKLSPGTKVSVTVESNCLAGEQLEKVRTDVTANLERLQLSVVEEAPLVFMASVTQGAPQTMTFTKRKFGDSPFSGGQQESVTATNYHSVLTLTEGGKQRWTDRSIGGGANFSYELKEGETIQSVVDRNSKPNLEYFKTVEIPPEVERKPDTFGRILGQSRLTENGAIPEAVPTEAELLQQQLKNMGPLRLR